MILTTSRYATRPIVSLPTTADGRATIAVFGPSPSLPRTFSYYVIKEGDRYDALAQRFYQRSDLWWLLADANPEVFYPDSLVAGVVIRVP